MTRMTPRHASIPTPVGALLTAALPALADGLLALAIRRDWPALVGREISRRAQPGDLRAGTLSVVVDNSPWLQELTLRQRELLARLQARYGVDSIREFRFTLGTPASVREEGDAPESPREDATLTAEEAAWVAGTAATVGDPSLAETVRRLLTKDALARRRGAGRR